MLWKWQEKVHKESENDKMVTALHGNREDCGDLGKPLRTEGNLCCDLSEGLTRT